MVSFERHIVVVLLIAFAAIAAAAVYIVAFTDTGLTNAGVPIEKVQKRATYAPPILDGFVATGEEMRDGDGDGEKETLVRHYRNLRGDSLFSMTTNGRLWAWSLDTQGDDDAVQTSYVIRDSNCDGRFDERYALDEEFQLPDCL